MKKVLTTERIVLISVLIIIILYWRNAGHHSNMDVVTPPQAEEFSLMESAGINTPEPGHLRTTRLVLETKTKMYTFDFFYFVSDSPVDSVKFKTMSTHIELGKLEPGGAVLGDLIIWKQSKPETLQKSHVTVVSSHGHDRYIWTDPNGKVLGYL